MAIGIYFVVGAIVIAAVLVSVLLLGRRGRGRLIQCPECGAQFPRPAYTEKSVGFGPSLPGIGNYTCPKCKYKGNVSYFTYVNKDEKKNESTSTGAK